MTHLPYDICLRLRDAGLPQPKPEFGQIWYEMASDHEMLIVVDTDEDDVYFYQKTGGDVGCDLTEFLQTSIFCPDAEYLAQHLNFISPPENPTDPPEKGILNFFVRNYLHRHEKKPAP